MNQRLVVFKSADGHHFYALVNVHTDDAFIQQLAAAAISDAFAETQEYETVALLLFISVYN